MAHETERDVDDKIAEHVKSIGLDRWSSLRKSITEFQKATVALGKREAAITLKHVLKLMDDAERFEEVAMAVKRAELTGDMDAMLVAMANLARL